MILLIIIIFLYLELIFHFFIKDSVDFVNFDIQFFPNILKIILFILYHY
jgi:hypothetical protein